MISQSQRDLYDHMIPLQISSHATTALACRHRGLPQCLVVVIVIALVIVIVIVIEVVTNEYKLGKSHPISTRLDKCMQS